MSDLTLTTNWFHKVDGLCSLIGYRGYLDDKDLERQLIEVSHEARRFAKDGVADRYHGGFPITLETMVEFAKAHGQLEALKVIVAAALTGKPEDTNSE